MPVTTAESSSRLFHEMHRSRHQPIQSTYHIPSRFHLVSISVSYGLKGRDTPNRTRRSLSRGRPHIDCKPGLLPGQPCDVMNELIGFRPGWLCRYSKNEASLLQTIAVDEAGHQICAVGLPTRRGLMNTSSTEGVPSAQFPPADVICTFGGRQQKIRYSTSSSGRPTRATRAVGVFPREQTTSPDARVASTK